MAEYDQERISAAPGARVKRSAVPSRQQFGMLTAEHPSSVQLRLVFMAAATYTISFAEQRQRVQAQLVVPPGAELIGVCAPGEPREGAYQFFGEDYAWIIPCEDVTAAPFVGSVVAEQRVLARERSEAAEAAFGREDYREAARLYDLAAFEELAAGGSFHGIGRLLMDHAIALVKAEAEENVIERQLELANRIYEWALTEAEWGHKLSTEHITIAEEASQIQVFLATRHLAKEEHAKARACLERLLDLNKRITKRYTVKVELLVYAADLYLQLGDTQEGSRVLQAADRFFQQQVVMQTAYDERAAGVARHLQRIKAKGQLSQQTMAYTLTANTADELQALLSALREADIEGLTLPTTFSRVPKGSSSRHGVVYTAKLRYKPSGVERQGESRGKTKQ